MGTGGRPGLSECKPLRQGTPGCGDATFIHITSGFLASHWVPFHLPYFLNAAWPQSTSYRPLRNLPSQERGLCSPFTFTPYLWGLHCYYPHSPMNKLNLPGIHMNRVAELTLKSGLSDDRASPFTTCNTIHDSDHRDTQKVPGKQKAAQWTPPGCVREGLMEG